MKQTGADKLSSGAFAATLLRTAADIVEGSRNAQHGEKERSFAMIADLWNAYLGSSLVTGTDVALMMSLLKIARSRCGDTSMQDHYVDMCGYAAIAGELESGK